MLVWKQEADIPSADSLDVMIQAVYDAAAEVTTWRDVGDRVAGIVGADLCTLWTFQHAEAHALCADQLPAAMEANFHRRYRLLDPWINGTSAPLRNRSATRRAFLGSELVADSALRESEFYRDFARTLGAFHLVGLAMRPDAEFGATLAIFRPETANSFEEADRLWVEALRRHLERAIFLHDLGLRRTNEVLLREAALEALSDAVLVVDKDMRVVVANARARAIATSDAGVSFQRAGNWLLVTAASRRGHDVLSREVRRVIERGDAGRTVRLRSATGRDDFVADIAPLTAAGMSTFRPLSVAMIVLRPVHATPAMPEPWLLQDIFGLTAAEAAVAIAVASGHSAPSIASLRRTTQATVRTQLRSVLEKTGAANLRALAVRLTNLAPSTNASSSR